MKAKTYLTTVIIEIAIFTFLLLLYANRYLDAKEKLNATNNLLLSTQEKLAASQEQLSSVTENLQLECEKSGKLAAELDFVTKSLDEANETILALKSTEYELVYVGEFKLTHYCVEDFDHICGNGDGLTATGTEITVGQTIAVDPTIIPYGTQVYIEGYGWYIADDCGGGVKGKHIDIAVNTHSEALSLGVKSGDVWILVKKNS